jgi:hypothetical protein
MHSAFPWPICERNFAARLPARDCAAAAASKNWENGHAIIFASPWQTHTHIHKQTDSDAPHVHMLRAHTRTNIIHTDTRPCRHAHTHARAHANTHTRTHTRAHLWLISTPWQQIHLFQSCKHQRQCECRPPFDQRVCNRRCFLQFACCIYSSVHRNCKTSGHGHNGCKARSALGTVKVHIDFDWFSGLQDYKARQAQCKRALGQAKKTLCSAPPATQAVDAQATPAAPSPGRAQHTMHKSTWTRHRTSPQWDSQHNVATLVRFSACSLDHP